MSSTNTPSNSRPDRTRQRRAISGCPARVAGSAMHARDGRCRSLYVPGAVPTNGGSDVENALVCGVITAIHREDWSLRHALNVLVHLCGDRNGLVPKDITLPFVLAFSAGLHRNYDNGACFHKGSFSDLDEVRSFVMNASGGIHDGMARRT